MRDFPWTSAADRCAVKCWCQGFWLAESPVCENWTFLGENCMHKKFKKIQNQFLFLLFGKKYAMCGLPTLQLLQIKRQYTAAGKGLKLLSIKIFGMTKIRLQFFGFFKNRYKDFSDFEQLEVCKLNNF
jgi:hypothetical protein